VEGMAWRESLSQCKSTSDDCDDAVAPTAPPVIVDDVSQFDAVFGSTDMNGDLSLKGVGSSNVGNGLCMSSSAAVNVSHINYELVGVVVHSGQANAGHYYSFIKDRRYDVIYTGRHVEVHNRCKMTTLIVVYVIVIVNNVWYLNIVIACESSSEVVMHFQCGVLVVSSLQWAAGKQTCSSKALISDSHALPWASVWNICESLLVYLLVMLLYIDT